MFVLYLYNGKSGHIAYFTVYIKMTTYHKNDNIQLSVYIPLQPPEMRTSLYRVEPLYSNTLKRGHLCIQWNSSIPTP